MIVSVSWHTSPFFGSYCNIHTADGGCWRRYSEHGDWWERMPGHLERYRQRRPAQVPEEIRLAQRLETA